MDAEEKNQVLDAVLNPDFSRSGQPDSIAVARAVRLFRDTGAERMTLPSASLLWQRHMAQQTALPAKDTRRKGARYIVPAIAAAAAVLVFVFYPRSTEQPTPAGITVSAPLELRYRNAADVHVKSAMNYRVTEERDSVRIEADAIVARIDFHANPQLRTVAVVTPAATYRIIGTSITVMATRERSALHVAEGKVQVEAAGSSKIVSRGEVWAIERGREERRGETESDRKQYRDLAPGRALPGEDKAAKTMDVKLPQDRLPGKTEGHRRPAESGPTDKAKSPRADTGHPQPISKSEPMESHDGKKAAEHTETHEQREERAAARAERQRLKAEREAARTEREARRAERQSGKTEKHR